MSCPHKDIRFCPLYVAMHIAGGPSCATKDLQDGCAVAQGASYKALVERLRVTWPGVVERCEWEEALADRRDQRARNLRTNGIH